MKVLSVRNGTTEYFEEKLADFESACRSHGLKMTHQRREIFIELIAGADHPSVETIYKRLREKVPTISLDTVYRTMATFESRGLVKRVQTMENQTRYEANVGVHHHFVCEVCQKIIDFDWRDFDQFNLPDALEHIGRIKEKNVVVQGVCHDCLDKKR
jgi:Fur family peroxide stress response transcriptional regulator